jgi:hypothetical protein
MARKLIDQDEAARILGVTPEEVGSLRDRKKLFPYRDGDQWKFKQEDLDRLKAEMDAEKEETGGDEKDGVKIDFVGAFLLLATNTLFLYTIRDLPHEGLNLTSISLLALSAAGFCLFILTELRVAVPILSLALFRSRLFTFANLTLFFITSSQAAIQFLMPFYLQSSWAFRPLKWAGSSSPTPW